MQHVADYLGDNDIFLDNYLKLCKEWANNDYAGICKDMEYTRQQNLEQAEEVVDHV